MNNLFRSPTRTIVLGFLLLEFLCGSLMTQSLLSTLLNSSLYASPRSPRAVVKRLANVSGVRLFFGENGDSTIEVCDAPDTLSTSGLVNHAINRRQRSYLLCLLPARFEKIHTRPRTLFSPEMFSAALSLVNAAARQKQRTINISAYFWLA